MSTRKIASLHIGIVLALLAGRAPGEEGRRTATAATVSPGDLEAPVEAAGACPTFSWSPATDARATELAVAEIDDSGEPQTRLRREIAGAASSWTPGRTECLEPGRIYAWTVRSVPTAERSLEGSVSAEPKDATWSSPRFFSIPAIPSEEELTAALELVERWRESRATLSGTADGLPARLWGAPVPGPSSGALKRRVGSASRIPELAEAPQGAGVLSAIRGEVADPTGFTAGVHGLQSSTEGGAGVLGETLSLTGNVKGVYGYTESTGGRGTIGVAAAESGATIGVEGWNLSPDGFGVLGKATAETGIATGVWAESSSTEGRGVTGLALATSGSAHGVLGQTASPNGGALVGVNLANGPDLILDGVAAGATTTVLREGSLERSSGGAETFDVRNSGGGGMTLTVAGNAVWHAGNDGPGSGLDADTLDGTQASAFQARVNGVCPLGQTIRGVNPDGSVVCYEVPVPPRTTTVDDPADIVGKWPSIAIGVDGFPVISYYDETAKSLKVVKCNDPDCTSGDETITTVDDPANFVGRYSSIAVAADGRPVISYWDETAKSLKVAKCNDAACAGANETITTVDDPANFVGAFTSLALGVDGFPVISYKDLTAGALKVVKCNDAACAGANETITTVDDPATDVGDFTSIAVGADGFPVISYIDGVAWSMKVAKCNDAACAGSNETITTVVDPSTFAGSFTSIAVGVDGFPVITYRAEYPGSLMVVKCNDAACAGANETLTTVDAPANSVGTFPAIAIGADGFPVISYQDYTARSLKVAKCNDAACAGANETITTVDDPANEVGYYTSIAIGSDGFPVISHFDFTAGTLKVLKCKNPSCSY